MKTTCQTECEREAEHLPERSAETTNSPSLPPRIHTLMYKNK